MFVIFFASNPPALCDSLAFAKGSAFSSYNIKYKVM